MLLTGLVASTVYREFFNSIVILASSEEYSYITVSLFSMVITLYLSLSYIGFSYGVRLSKIIFATLLALFSLALYSVSTSFLEYKIQLEGLSFSLFFISLILLVYDPVTPGEIIPLLTPFLLIPLPAGFVDRLTPLLSRYIGRVAGFLTGVRVVETPGFTQLEVPTPSGGVARFSIEAACTGIVTLSSIMSVIPVLIYMVTFSSDKPLRKTVVSLASIIISLLIGLLGNLIRVLLIVYGAMYMGVQQAETLFHYSPSLVYSFLSALIAFYLVNKYSRFPPVFTKALAKHPAIDVSWEYVSGVFIVAAFFTLIVLALVPITTTASSVQQALVVNPSSVDDYVKNPEKYLSTTTIVFTGKQYDQYLTNVLGALAVYRVEVVSPTGIYQGYVEVVDTTARLHTWQLCLTVQGYNILSSWSSVVNNTRIVFIALEKGSWRGLLGYVILPVTLEVGGETVNMYTRVSLMAPGDPTTLAGSLTSVFASMTAKLVGSGSGVEAAITGVQPLTMASALISAMFIIYATIVYSWGLIRKLVKR
jgi:exosortase/archaeosortase family protein